MRKILFGLIGIILIQASAAAQTRLTPAEFTAHALGELVKAAPNLKVAVKSPLALDVALPNGLKMNANLHKTYASYLREPERRDEYIARFVRVTLDVAAMADRAPRYDKASIIPIIRSASLLRGDAGDFRRNSTADVIAHERLTPEVILIYAEDRPESLSLLRQGDIPKLGLSPADLRALAIDNLRRLLAKKPAIEYERDEDGFFIVHGDGLSEASLILLPEIWTKANMPVKGDFVIAVPTRSILLVTGSEESTVIELLRRIAREEFEAGPYSLSPELYRLRGGGLETLP